MATLRDMLYDAITHAAVPISDRNFITWYNSAVDKLAMTYNTAKQPGTQTVVCTDIGGEYPLTVGSIGIDRVLDSGGTMFAAFTVRNGKLLFGRTGTFTVHLQFMPMRITSMNEELNVPEVYRGAIVWYVAAMALKASSRDKAVREDAAEAMENFVTEANAANAALRNNTNKNKQVAVRRWR